MIGVMSYGCSTSAGSGVSALWNGVSSGTDFAQPISAENWPVKTDFQPKACLWPGERNTSAQERMLTHLHNAWSEVKASVPVNQLSRVAVILASTKGPVEDFVWSEQVDHQRDFLSPLLSSFCRTAEIASVRQAVVSNACSSSLSAVWLASQWLEAGQADHVIIVAVDGVGPFVLQGFHCLNALTKSNSRPFSAARDGLQLGEAAAILVLSKKPSDCYCVISGVAIDAEGYAVTRPSPSGESLRRAVKQLSGAPDLIIAHGTGTALNDETEDQVFFQEFGTAPAITASKWSIGHTLGACGALDIILACESIRRGTAFAMANTASVDPQLRSRYLTQGTSIAFAPRRVVVSSLGFGGIHAVAMVERAAV